MRELEEIFGIKTDNFEYFENALTHPSYTKLNNIDYTRNYERLEFLGDAVLKLCVSDILYKKYPEYHEGDLSKIRSITVADSTLMDIVQKNGLYNLIKLGKHEEKQGCRNLESVCACAFEAVLGAYYLDGKFNELLKYIKTVFTPYIEDADKNFAKFNAKAILQEYTQSLNKDLPQYVVVNKFGPAHNLTFEVEVSYNGKVMASGEGKSKKEAEQNAAYKACVKMGVLQCQE